MDNRKMKRLITIATSNIREHCSELLENQREYAAAQGLEYCDYEQLHPDFADVHPVYSRLGYVMDALKEGADKVIWADADVVFIDHTRDLCNLVDVPGITVARWEPGTKGPELYNADGYWLAGYRQTNWPGAYLCFGLLVFRNTWLTKAFLNEIMTTMRENPEVSAREQYYAQKALIKINFAGVRLCSGREIGCFAPQIWHDGTVWEEGMPTVHLAGPADWERRRRVFLEYYKNRVKK